jgi:hypothetical protein
MILYQFDRVSTPLGNGIVLFAKYRESDYNDLESVSVLLDSKAEDTTYEGTIFPIEQVRPLKDDNQ